MGGRSVEKLLALALVKTDKLHQVACSALNVGRVYGLSAVRDRSADNCHLHGVYGVVILPYARPRELVFIRL